MAFAVLHILLCSPFLRNAEKSESSRVAGRPCIWAGFRGKLFEAWNPVSLLNRSRVERLVCGLGDSYEANQGLALAILAGLPKAALDLDWAALAGDSLRLAASHRPQDTFTAAFRLRFLAPRVGIDGRAPGELADSFFGRKWWGRKVGGRPG